MAGGLNSVWATGLNWMGSWNWAKRIRSRITKRHLICETDCNNHVPSQGANRKASYLRRAVVAPRVTQEKEETLQPGTKGTGFWMHTMCVPETQSQPAVRSQIRPPPPPHHHHHQLPCKGNLKSFCKDAPTLIAPVVSQGKNPHSKQAYNGKLLITQEDEPL